MRISVIGLGLIGGSIAKDLRREAFCNHIIGIDSSEDNANKALELGIVDEISSLDSGVSNCDLVIIAIPVNHTLAILPRILDNIKDTTTVTDMGSTKQTIVETVKNHKRRANYVPAHPMSGTENSGPEAAEEGLFKNRIAIICDHKESSVQHIALVEKMFQYLGMSIAYMSSAEQDLSTAFVSHLPHAASYALANAVQSKENQEIIFDLASGGFRSAVRLAKSSPQMWAPIFTENKTYVLEALDVYIKHLKSFRDDIAKEDATDMYRSISNANKIREVLDNKNPLLIKDEQKIIKLYTRKI
ncbi:prephenate dehydrogenase [Halosquirtibacter laminarini]|uniref:Prephenate dehydrogenase n=1 Tax=Halosquirtibacter laminarini TaxID=3374600 RepID=A0AC61NEI8_9BACT|nr:prephenate dehydrogenase [Prolixibacteraceae bacterium]